MHFGTPQTLEQIRPALVSETADGKNNFQLTDEELAYVRSLDAQTFGAREALDSVISAAQVQYEKTMARVNLAKENFMLHLANKHKVKLTKDSTVKPLDGIFQVSQPELQLPNMPTSTGKNSLLELFKQDLQAGGDALDTMATNAIKNSLTACNINSAEDLSDIVCFCVAVRTKFPDHLLPGIAPIKSLLNSLRRISDQLVKEGRSASGLDHALKSKDKVTAYAIIQKFCDVDNEKDLNKKSACEMLNSSIDALLDNFFEFC